MKCGQSMSAEMLNLGTSALALLGQCNKLMNNKQKEFHKKDLDDKYHYLFSVNFPFTEWLYGDDLNKNAKELQDLNKLSRNMGLGTSQHGAYGHSRARRGYPRYTTRARGVTSVGTTHPTTGGIRCPPCVPPKNQNKEVRTKDVYFRHSCYGNGFL